MQDLKDLEQKALDLRNEILDRSVLTGTGHLTSSFSCVEILTVLYYGGILKYSPRDSEWDDRDYFLMSKGHASPALYAVLGDVGYFPKSDLDLMGKANGKIGVHLQHDVPGVEATSGSLGNGLGLASGIALGLKMNRKNSLVFALLGDGECYEGSIWEAAMFAGHNGLDNLIVIVDRNYMCATNFTETTLSLEPFEDKWKAFGYRVKTVDGHSIQELMDALKDIRSFRRKQPIVIIANTVKGKGIPMYENDPLAHGVSPKGESAVIAKQQLNEEV